MIGETLKKLREGKNLSQTEIAKILGIPQRTYSDYETNKADPKLDTLIKIAEFYQTSTDYLLGRYK